MKLWMRITSNFFLMAFSLTVFFGGAEFLFRYGFPEKVKTYFDVQSEAELGEPVPPKQDREYRIFIFGGSAAYGFPVADRYSIAAWMRKSFPHLLAGKKVRVMNCAWPGKGSHHVLEGARSVLKYEPDLFIIYSGHNEVPAANRLYADNWLYWLNMRLYFRSAFYRYMWTRLDRLRKHFVYGHSGFAEKHYREEVIANKVYRRSDVTDHEYERLLARYLRNIKEIIRLAKRRGVSVLFVNLPSNLRDIPPELSLHSRGLTAENLRDWEHHYREGQELEAKQSYPAALRAYEQARKIDSEYAELHYRLGKVYEQLARYAEAKEAYRSARDLDRIPWRARSSMNDLIHETAVQENLLFVDLIQALERISAHGIIGSDLVYDNVHPSVQAQQVISDEILRVLMRAGKIAPAGEWRWETLGEARERIENSEWQVDGVVNAYRYILRGMNLWGQGRYVEMIPDLEKGLRLMPGFIESYAFLGDAYWRMGEAKKASESFLALANKDRSLLHTLLRKYPDLEISYMESSKSVSWVPSAIR